MLDLGSGSGRGGCCCCCCCWLWKCAASWRACCGLPCACRIMPTLLWCRVRCRMLTPPCWLFLLTAADCYVCSALVGQQGSVTGIDMTLAQLEVARKHADEYCTKVGMHQDAASAAQIFWLLSECRAHPTQRTAEGWRGETANPCCITFTSSRFSPVPPYTLPPVSLVLRCRPWATLHPTCGLSRAR